MKRKHSNSDNYSVNDVISEDRGEKHVDEQNEQEEESDESSSDEQNEPVYSVSLGRAKRVHAGNKMGVLLESAEHEDEFYKNIFGDLNENNDDDPEYDEESDEDVVDSDFDRSEEEDEPISDEEEKQRKKRRITFKVLLSKINSFFEEPEFSRKKLLERNKKWIMAKMSGRSVAANQVSRETQETERLNIASLQKYEQFELERKKKREKVNTVRKLAPPYISIVDAPNKKFMVLPDVKKFEKAERKVKLLCCVTSRPAKYRDPLTGLPYANIEAFKIIREKYMEYLRTFKNDEEISQWLSDISCA
ncbi:unnamed protein product [Dracunculus medinensis]|uniref:Vacuolar protein sorting-associated protein 72 homolog n=1 Tax=Dracunculus medinensis TaxID=318479 RepID=A0A0N4U1E3_DRAME|nr:unnamed protein product [Dracunculus medinensis]